MWALHCISDSLSLCQVCVPWCSRCLKHCTAVPSGTELVPESATTKTTLCGAGRLQVACVERRIIQRHSPLRSSSRTMSAICPTTTRTPTPCFMYVHLLHISDDAIVLICHSLVWVSLNCQRSVGLQVSKHFGHNGHSTVILKVICKGISQNLWKVVSSC